MAKKSFKDDFNPAMTFISPDSKKQADQPAPEEMIQDTTTFRENAPENYKVDPRYIEKRNKRLQSLIQPSIYEKIKNEAAAEGVSINEIVNRIFLEHFEKRESDEY